jgi:hypothetical protein
VKLEKSPGVTGLAKIFGRGGWILTLAMWSPLAALGGKSSADFRMVVFRAEKSGTPRF